MAEPEAGPELDARMAELMGYKPYGGKCLVIAPGEYTYIGGRVYRRQGEIMVLFEPSTDWSAAEEVLAKLHQDGWTVFIEGDVDGWVVRFQRPGDPHTTDVVSVYSDAPTAPLAICRAALKAVEKTDG